MTRNLLYLAILALVIVAGALAFQVYRDRQNPTGLNIDIGKSGVTIQSH